MKKTETPRPQRLRRLFQQLRMRLGAPLYRLGIRGRVFVYFLLFTICLLALLWIFQIALLSDFYKLQKTEMLTSSLDTLARNIDSEDLQLLSDRISQANDVCVLVLNDKTERLISSEANRDCVIHRMSGFDLNRLSEFADQSEKTIYRIFEQSGPSQPATDGNRFEGRVPQASSEHAQSMVAFRAVQDAQGERRYLFINAIITPVDATVQTLRSQYLFIAVLMVLLSFGISLVLSRRIARPIVDTSLAARGLSEGRFEPANTHSSYREILQLNATLRQAAKDLRRVEEMQRELIANISHDLRTPLTLIDGYAEAMRDLPGENTPENMQVIIDETRRLSSLVNAVLEYSASHSGQAPVERKPFSLTHSIEGILARYRKLIEQDGYTVALVQDGDATVFADEMQIGQVLYNLINNALTYTGEDRTVTVTQTLREAAVRVSVHDSGEGIDAEELPYIWDRYYRGHKPHKRATVGSGLGLSIVKGILDRHGLAYGVQSHKDTGTTFWFELPLANDAPPTSPEASKP
ncbi:MAG: HAMP domain-containing sensor histidine kinase [Candidatus Limiplasma sp.]|nr:HAMP domain-containing sensor histidine kinase [Candidatus Limiplasma sp.]